MGKPKKSNSSGVIILNRQEKPIVGSKVRFIGLYGANFSCPNCPTSKRTGMVVEHQGKLYCSHHCAGKE